MRALAFAVAAALVPGGACGKQSPGGEVRVAGASDLVFAMEDVIERFEAETGKKVTFIPGSSGKLASQIREGAPYDVFFSANVTYVDDVIASGACDAKTRGLYAQGRIVMWTRPGAGKAPPADIGGLARDEYVKIAIANPDHAPYGAAARQALRAAGVWDRVSPKLVYGSNIRDTMQFVETGNAEVGIVALSLAIKSEGKRVEIPESLHRPIVQAMVACNKGPAAELGRRFAAFMTTPAIREVMKSYGFSLPRAR